MQKTELSQRIVNSIINLAKVNYLTGYWDTRRGKIAKDFIDTETFNKKNYLQILWDLIGTEMQSRFNCEQRATYRAILDSSFKELLCQK